MKTQHSLRQRRSRGIRIATVGAGVLALALSGCAGQGNGGGDDNGGADADGKEYVDLVCSWGPALLGHAHPAVLDAVHAAVDRGLSFGASTPDEANLAEIVKERVPAHATRRDTAAQPSVSRDSGQGMRRQGLWRARRQRLGVDFLRERHGVLRSTQLLARDRRTSSPPLWDQPSSVGPAPGDAGQILRSAPGCIMRGRSWRGASLTKSTLVTV